jgi:hypothetical protein
MTTGGTDGPRAPLAAASEIVDDFDVVRGVQSVNSTAMITPITTMAIAGFPKRAMRPPNASRGNGPYTRAESDWSRSAARSSVSCFLQNANRIMFLPRPAPAW